MADRIDTDAVLHRTMNQLHLEDHPIDLEGDLYRTIDERHKGALDLPETAADVGHEAEKEVLTHLAFHKVAATLGWMGTLPIAAGIETIAKAFETMEQGDELKEGLQRDCVVGACSVLCGSALPKGFTADLYGKFATRGELPAGAHNIYSSILSQPDGSSIRDGLTANCQDGQRYAIDRHITSEAELAVALKQNPELCNRYQHDLAFKLGTDSVIWASAHGQLPAIDQRLNPTPVATSLEVRG